VLQCPHDRHIRSHTAPPAVSVPVDWRDTTAEHSGTIIGIVGAGGAQQPPKPPYVLPPNFRDVTAEKIGMSSGLWG
jgi:hypothetical protein